MTGPDPDEVPVWMGIASQMPVTRSGRTSPWERERERETLWDDLTAER